MRYSNSFHPVAAALAAFLFSMGTVSLMSCGGGNAPAEAGEGTTGPAELEGSGGRAARTLPLPGAKDEAGGQLPPGHPPLDEGSSIAPPQPPTAAITWKVPESWIVQTPSSGLRYAQYRVPGSAGDGECVVYYFGPGQGGDPHSNAARWASQFTQPDGSSSMERMKTRDLRVGDANVLLVEVTGTYDGGMTMTMEPAKEQTGYMLLGAVVEGPDAPWFFKLTGPEKTLRAQREAFETMIRSIRAA